MPRHRQPPALLQLANNRCVQLGRAGRPLTHIPPGLAEPLLAALQLHPPAPATVTSQLLGPQLRRLVLAGGVVGGETEGGAELDLLLARLPDCSGLQEVELAAAVVSRLQSTTLQSWAAALPAHPALVTLRLSGCQTVLHQPALTLQLLQNLQRAPDLRELGKYSV